MQRSAPDFSEKTKKTLARRAAFRCSNPDCRATTVGPNSDPEKATLIGEAAHILGARPTAKRFSAEMSPTAISAITNGIWLCRNCHKLVDSDDQLYPSTVLFAWRERHEQFVMLELGNSADQIRGEQRRALLEEFASYPPLIRRIVIDKQDGWEWRLTAELMRHLNGPLLRKLSDLRAGLHAAPQEHIAEDEASEWVQQRLSEMSRLMAPMEGLIQRLNQAWGEPGEPRSVDEIHHVCELLEATLEQIVLFEERVYFANGPESYQKVLMLLRDIAGSQADKLAEIPDFLDTLVVEVTDYSGPPKAISKTITIEAPQPRLDNLVREIKRAENPGCALGILLWLMVSVS